MAANQELKNYIAEQTKLGISKDVVKSALLAAGWKEDDISQAMTEAQPGSQSMGSFSPASPVQPIQQQPSQPIKQTQPFQAFQSAKPTEAPQTFKPVNMPGSFSTAAKDSPVSFVTSDIFQPKSESVFKSSGTKSQTSQTISEANPQAISTIQNNKSGTSTSNKILSILLGVLSVILLGGNVYFFLQNSSLSSKVDSLNSGKASSDTQVASLATSKKDLTDQVNLLNQTVLDLDNQLSLYEWPSNASQTQEMPITIKGILGGGGGKTPYSLTTNKNIIVTVKNSKDVAVDGVLKPLLGAEVAISGTHLVKSDSITVTTVNGASVLSLQSSSTSTAGTATSTGKAASSTP